MTMFIRLDKIGDLVLTLPVDEAEFLRGHEITWVVEKSVGFLCDVAEPKRIYYTLSVKNPMGSFFGLLRLIREKKPREVVIFYAPWWVSLVAWLGRVPVRVGRLSQWHSFLFLNRALRQSRSMSDRHEAEYNWELVHFAFNEKITSSCPFLKIRASSHRQLLEKYDLSPKAFFVVHPGMAGSALNWPQARYNELIERLLLKGPVVITGTSADLNWLTEIAPRWKNHPQVRWLVEKLDIQQLIYILQSAQAVVGPSTGVLHLAASSGTPVIGLYSEVPSQHPRRWAPRGLGVRILTPSSNATTSLNAIEVQDVLGSLP